MVSMKHPRRVIVLGLVLAALSTTGLVAHSVTSAPEQRPAAADTRPDVGYTAPSGPVPVVLRAFDRPPQPWAAGHRGVDLAASGSVPLVAPERGTVTFVGRVVDRGVLVLEHPDGLRTSLEPVSSHLRAGDTVARGEAVARLEDGVEHCLLGPCVHWGVRSGEQYLDPMLLLGERRVVLLPAP